MPVNPSPPKGPLAVDLPLPQVRREGNGYRAFTENGCVFAATADEALLKHQERMNGRVKKGWPTKGKKKTK